MTNINPIPQEIKSPTKFYAGIYFIDLVIVIVYWLFFSNFENIVHPNIRVFYTAFNVIVAFILTRQSRYNPEKRIYQSILYSFIKDKKTYHVRRD